MQTPRRENSKSQRVAMTSDSGGKIVRKSEARLRREIRTHLYLHFILGTTSGPTRRVLREIADRNRRCSNALRVPPHARRVLAAEQATRV